MGFSKYPSYRHEARRLFGQFPIATETKAERVARKQAESIPLERTERRALQLDRVCRTADRILTHSTPIGTARAVVTRSRKHKGPDVVTVYLIRFSPINYDEAPFLKIGISNSVGERFEDDCYRFKVSVLAKIGDLSRKTALDIERRLHAMFNERSYTPKLRLLSGGNTECFVDDDEIVSTFEFLVGLIKDAALAQR